MADQPPVLIPLETFFGNPDRVSPQLSPGGGRMTWIAPDEGVLNVWIREVGSEDARALTRDRGRGIRGHGWAWDDRHVLYVQDTDGDENWRIFAVNVETGEERCLTPKEEGVEHPVQAQLYASIPERPTELLIGLNRRDPRAHDMFLLDIASGAREPVMEGAPDIAGFVVDNQLRVRGLVRSEPAGGMRLFLREREEDAFEEVLRWDPEDELNSHPIGFTGDDRRLLMLDSRGRDTAALVELDTSNGTLRVLASDDEVDVSGAKRHPKTHEVQAVSFRRARREWKILDEGLSEDFEHLAKNHPGDFGIVDASLDDQTWLVAYTVDDGPLAYFVHSREERKTEPLFVAREALVGLPLAKMEPIAFEARDGLTIRGYLTKPRWGQAPWPLVLNVHGGPWHRDTWGYDPEAQWLANRGYAVLQVNFRGSTGYGKSFLNAGNREWGAKMQDDLTDAVRWAIAEGVADAERVAIYGGSYGGYATLAGVTFTPELYRCGVSIVGPSNLVTFLDSVPPYWESFRAALDRRVGKIPRYEEGERAGQPKDEADMSDAERAEMDFLRSRSPLFHVDRVRVPMLVAQGANDPRVVKAESDQFVDAMKAKGLPVEYVVYEDEGHGFARPENRLDFYRKAERFLGLHLGGRVEEG